MPQKSKLKLPPINTGNESFGQRLARLRKEKGYTQTQLADKMGLVQALISEYERDKLRPYHEMIARFALALDVSADDLLGINAPKTKNTKFKASKANDTNRSTFRESAKVCFKSYRLSS